MEGLIPFLIKTMQKQRPQNAYRCLSDSSSGRSYQLLLSDDSIDGGGSFHRRTNVENFLSSNSEHLSQAHRTNIAAASPSTAGNGLRHRGFMSVDHYQVSAA